MKVRLIINIVSSLLILISSCDIATAAQTIQNTTLKPGWNAVFLEVQPASADPADVFNGITDLESVWLWNPQTSTVEFVQDPSIPVPQGSTWLNYYPANPVLTNLNAIRANTPYLIKLGGSSDVIWSVTGEPVVPHIDWQPNSFNFVGFHLAPGQEPLFEDFFSSSAAHAGQDIYVLDNASGNWQKVAAPLTTAMRRGEAFFIFNRGYSDFTGPLSAQPEQFSGLHYGKALQEQSVIIRNHSAAAKSVSLSLSALNDTLHYWLFNPAQQVAAWQPFTDPLVLQIPAGDMQNLRLGVRRADLSADTAYDANLTVTDGDGMEFRLPVSVTGISYSGLWVGDATITRVNEPARPDDPATPENDAQTPVKTGSEFSFRLILHVDETDGTVRLLSQVIQMWQEGTYKADPNDLGKLVIDEPGGFVLLTDDSLIADFSGAAIRDGQLVGRRVSSAAFPSLNAQERVMTGSMYPSAGDLSVMVAVAENDPSNPFRHKFQPDHLFQSDPVPPEQSYQVTRAMTLTFSDVDQEGRPITGVPALSWGSVEVGGIYKESITGLHRNTLHIEGTFLLRKVSDVGTLTSSAPM